MNIEHNPFNVDENLDSSFEEFKFLVREQEIKDFVWLMTHKQGRRVMQRLLSMTGVFRNPYVPGDEGGTNFRCGEQNIGQQLLAEIDQLCPDKYCLMLKEQKNYVRKFERQ